MRREGASELWMSCKSAPSPSIFSSSGKHVWSCRCSLVPPLLQEFEDARLETDPEIMNRLIITGRDAVQRVVDSFWARRNRIIEEEAAQRDRGDLPPTAGGPLR